MIWLWCAWAAVAVPQEGAVVDVEPPPVDAAPVDPTPAVDATVVEAPVEAPAAEAPVSEDVVVVDAPRALSPWVQTCLRQVPDDVEGARLCLQTVIADRDTPPADRSDAVEAELVLARLQRHLPARPIDEISAAPSRSHVSTVVVSAGNWAPHLEAGVHGAVLGGIAGFTGAAGVLSASRTSEDEAFPWLLSAPALGVIVGAGAGVAAVEWLDADADDVAFVASTTWAGVALGFTLQLAIFADSGDVQAAPLRFFTTLGGGALGLGLGAGLAPFLDVESGDAALANGGLVWGSVLAAQALGSVGGAGLDFATSTIVVGAGGLLSWGVLTALHPLLRLHRASTWLVDVGGVLGLMGGAVLGGMASSVVGGAAFVPVWTLGTAAGLSAGVVSALIIDKSTRSAFEPPAPLAVAPTFFPTRGGHAPGVVVRVALW